eukprot:TRINITY_DN247_c0_g1_i2.p1 TRINITY_DN247_c0_g1~~TRINITY_DN247_c0_g1_i2.p1  ORF type:complete len:191 (+),score=37.65 TRINITY_DN247_c0_g1_i2:742-1314(+)
MKDSHGFVLPMYNYISDLEGLVAYLNVKVSIGFICIQCGLTEDEGKIFYSLEAVLGHMKDKSHYHLNVLDNMDEYERFYDFDRFEKERPRDISELENHVSGLVLPNGNQFAVPRHLAIAYEQPEGRTEIVPLSEEQKLIISRHKKEKIAKSRDQRSIHKHQKRLLASQLKHNSSQRRALYLGDRGSSIHH